MTGNQAGNRQARAKAAIVSVASASPVNAQVLAACLQNEGLSPVVMDVNTILAAGALFNSLPRGGVRVMVPESQLEAALAIRAAFDAGEMAIDENDDAWKK